MKKSEIIQAIDKTVMRYKPKKYSVWTIGITDDPKRRKGEHNNPKDWHQWKADTEAAAQAVEKHFLDRGMKGAPGGGESPNYVYIF